MRFLKNVWHIAAWSENLQIGATLERMIIGHPLVVYRTPSGTVVALNNRLPVKE